MADKKPTFEKDLEKLEEIVTALEEGGLSLDDSLKRFEEGIALARRCEKALTEAEKRIEILTKNADGELEAKPFGDDADEAAEHKEKKPAKAQAKESEDDGEDNEDDEDGLLF
jgi:exodeoxyribonuclease VII small subunit